VNKSSALFAGSAPLADAHCFSLTTLRGYPDTVSLSGTQLQREALGELLQVILASDDYTRKPALISFYQSLALVLSSKATSKL